MQFTQQQRIAFSDFRSQGLTFSRIEINNRLIPSTPLLLKYRTSEKGVLVISHEPNIFCSIFGMESASEGLCKCGKRNGYCQLVMGWIQECYDWERDCKFTKVYERYGRKAMEVGMSEEEMRKGLRMKMKALGMAIGERDQEMLIRVIKNYIKHTIYYGKSQALTQESDIFIWLTLGLFYHLGSTQTKVEPLIFWSLDILMNSLKSVSQASIQQHSRRTLDLIRDYFPNSHQKILGLEQVVNEWVSQLMMGYMGVQSIGFFANCLLKVGWNYVYKTILSYVEKRIEKMENQQTVGDRESVLKLLIDSDEEWPMIFCNAGSFTFDQL